MKAKQTWLIISGLVCIAIIIAGIAILRKPTSEKIIKIGAILPLTEAHALLGQGEKEGLTLAMEEINNKGGVAGKKLDIIFEDSRGDPKTGVSSLRKLVEVDKAQIIYSSLTGVSTALAPIVKGRRDIVLGVYAMEDRITSESDNIFRIYPSFKEEGEQIVEYLKTQNISSCGIIYFQLSGFEHEVKDIIVPALKDRKVNNIAVEIFSPTTKDFRSIVAKMKDIKPQVIILLGYSEQFLPIFKAIDENRLIGKVLIVGGMNLRAAEDIPRKLLENTVAVGSAFMGEGEHQSRVREAFTKQYEGRYNKKPDYNIAFSFDSLLILADALEKANANISKTLDMLTQIKSFEGASGKLTILPDRNSSIEWTHFVYKNGKWLPLRGRR